MTLLSMIPLEELSRSLNQKINQYGLLDPIDEEDFDDGEPFEDDEDESDED